MKNQIEKKHTLFSEQLTENVSIYFDWQTFKLREWPPSSERQFGAILMHSL